MDKAKKAEKELRRQQWEAATPGDIKAQEQRDRLAFLRLKFRRDKLREETTSAKAGIVLTSLMRVNHRLETRIQKAGMASFQRDRAKLRPESRAHHLAQGFLNNIQRVSDGLPGRQYKDMERFCYTMPNWDRVGEIVLTHMIGDPRIFAQQFAQWLATAKDDCDLRVRPHAKAPLDKHQTRMKLENKLIKLREAINALAA